VTDPEPLDRQTSTASTSTSTSTSSSTVVMASTTTSTSTTATPPVAFTTTTTLSRSCGSSDIPRVIGRRLGRAYNLITMSAVRAHERTRWRVRKALRLVRVAELHLGTVRDLAPECREAIRRCADDIRTVTKVSLVEYRDGT